MTLKAKSCAIAVMSRREFIHSAREERGQMPRRMLALSFCQAGVFKDVRGLPLYPWGDTGGGRSQFLASYSRRQQVFYRALSRAHLGCGLWLG